MINYNIKNKIIKILVIALEILAIGVIIYLVVLPFYPLVKYKLIYENSKIITPLTLATSSLLKVPEKVKEDTLAHTGELYTG